MKKISMVIVLFILLLSACGTPVPAASQAGIEVFDPFAHTAGAGETTAAYMIIKNSGSEADVLLNATCDEATMVQVMESMMMAGDVMSMGDVPGIDLPAGKSVELRSGSYHIMLMDMKQELKADSTINLTLEFAKAGKIVLNVPVLVLGATP
jgi:copper(I)-binding protein